MDFHIALMEKRVVTVYFGVVYIDTIFLQLHQWSTW